MHTCAYARSDCGFNDRNSLPTVFWISEAPSERRRRLVIRCAESRVAVVDPLSPSTWVTRVSVEIQTANFAAAAELIGVARRIIGDQPILQFLETQTLGQLRAPPGTAEFDRFIADMESRPNAASNPLLAALKGESQKAIELANAAAESSPRPILQLQLIYCVAGDYGAARDVMRRVDAAPTGPAEILIWSAQRRNETFKDFAAMPNLVRQMRQAGLNPAAYPGDCPPGGTD